MNKIKLKLSQKRILIILLLVIVLPLTIILLYQRFDLRQRAQVANLRALVNPVGFAAGINLDRIDNTVNITSSNQVSTFQNAIKTPWTRVIVNSGVNLVLTETLRPATGVKIYAETGSFHIDGRNVDWTMEIKGASDVYMANFSLTPAVGDTSLNNNYATGIAISTGSDNIYLQSFSINAPGNNGQKDAAEAFQIYNWPPGSAQIGRVTLDRARFVTGPSTGSKGILIGGDTNGDGANMQITILHSVWQGWQRNPMIGQGAYLDYFNNVTPRVSRIDGIAVRDGGKVIARNSFIHKSLNEDRTESSNYGGGNFTSVNNTLFEGAIMNNFGSQVSAPSYATPPLWTESQIMSNSGAGSINLSPSSITPSPTPQSANISPWTAIDIGNPLPGGQAKISDGDYDIYASGIDIWGSSDQMRYAYQTKSGDFTVTSQITGITETDPWAKAGLMVRANTNANSPFIFVHTTPSGNGVNFVSRETAGAQVVNEQQFFTSLPIWIRITRTGNTYRGYYSTNGTTFNTIGPVKSTNLGSNPLVGMATTSHNADALTTASYRNASLSGSTKTGDINGDGQVGILDLSILLSNWGSSNPSDPDADINKDGTVGILDLSILLSNWGT